MSAPIISVVIPVYNAERYIAGLFESLKKQTPACFEAIFIDDGSTDRSLEILKGLAAGESGWARIISRENTGVSRARNDGINAAKGDYITFIDADDAIADNYMEVISGYAAGGQALTVFSHARTTDGQTRFDAPYAAAYLTDTDALLEKFILNPTAFGVYDLLMRREVITRNGIDFPEGYAYYEDYSYILKAFCAVSHAWIAGECVYCYRASPGSAMNRFDGARLECLQLFDDEHSLCIKDRVRPNEMYRKWFAARIRWSIMWQACVKLKFGEAAEFGRKHDMAQAMRQLGDYPDRRVALSARVYLISRYAYVIIMKRMGKRRTLIPRGNVQ